MKRPGSPPTSSDRWRLLPIEPFRQCWWGDAPVGIFDYLGDLLPVHRDIEVDAEPATMTYIRRSEEASRFRLDPGLLDSCRGGAPESEAIVVMVIGVADEHFLVSDEPGRLAMTESLVGLGEPETKGAQNREGILRHVANSDRAEPTDYFLTQ
jgi:hypothetical protein